MEHWIVYHRAEYEALPWPFDLGWAEFLSEQPPLVHVCADFGRVSPCDGFGEMASVPAFLPRERPEGDDSMAIYHDADWLYAVLEVVRGRTVSGLGQEEGIGAVLKLLTADRMYFYHFGLDERGRSLAGQAPNFHGSRLVRREPPDFRWESAVQKRPRGLRCCWRVARASIPLAFDGDRLSLSLGIKDDRTLEAVAWGSHWWWSPRMDEMGVVRLVTERRTLPWPVVRRVDLEYDPAAETGRFRVYWDGAYGESETIVPENPLIRSTSSACHSEVRVNDRAELLPLEAEVVTSFFALADGWNRVQCTAPGGPPLVFHFEKRGGTRIRAADLPSAPDIDRAALDARIEQAVVAHLGMDEAQRAERRRNFRCDPVAGLGLARLYHYWRQDGRLLDAVRDEADHDLTLQRPDGTFAGSHLWHLWKRAGEPERWHGGAYDTGPAGELWILAWRLFGNEKYLAASSRLVEAYSSYRIEDNHNYAAFTLWHLAEHYRETRDPQALRHADYYAREIAGRGITPCGYQGGHNFYTCYGVITLRGLALYCQVMPREDPFRPVLRERCLRMTNQLLARQQPDGLFSVLYLNGSLGATEPYFGLGAPSLLCDPQEMRATDRAVRRLLAGVQAGRHKLDLFTLGEIARYLALRERLLAGETVDGSVW